MNTKVFVTHRNNVDFDENGQLILDENGEVIFKDETFVGHIIDHKTDLTTVIDPDSGQPTFAMISRALVAWENSRTPAYHIEDPANLVWLTLGEDMTEENDEEQEDEEFDDEEFDNAQSFS